MEKITSLPVVTSLLLLLGITNVQAQYSYQNVNSQLVNKGARTITSDNNGNVITTGNFLTTITIGGTTLTNSYPSTNSDNDLFIAKVTPAGAYAWATKVVINSISPKKSCPGQPGNVYVYGACTDVPGNIYLTGSFASSITCGPSTLTSLQYPGGGSCPMYGGDLFVAKISPSGSFLWARSEGTAATSDVGYSITTDATGNVYVTGQQIVSAGTGTNCFYVVKYNSSGTKQWEKKYTSTLATNALSGYSIVSDGSNVYASGAFSGTVNFGGGNIFNAGTTTMNALLKLDGSGNTTWAKAATTNYDGLQTLLLDNGNADLYLGCNISGTATFGTVSVTALASSSPALAKFSSATGTCSWAVVSGYQGTGINVFKHPNGEIGVVAANQGDPFTIKEFSSSGTQTNATVATNVASSSTGLLITGTPNGFAWTQNLKGSYDFGGTTIASTQALSSGYRDIILVTYAVPPPAPQPRMTYNVSPQLSVYPNPAQDKLTIESMENIGWIRVVDMSGRTVIAVTAKDRQMELDISALSAGVFFIRTENCSKPVKVQKL
jgi:hypothetical protein